MRKFAYVFLILCVLFIGMELGVPSKEVTSGELNERIDNFEREITNPNNNYKPGQDNHDINPNITNDIAKTGEKAITSVFDFAFGLLESLVSR